MFQSRGNGGLIFGKTGGGGGGGKKEEVRDSKESWSMCVL